MFKLRQNSPQFCNFKKYTDGKRIGRIRVERGMTKYWGKLECEGYKGRTGSMSEKDEGRAHIRQGLATWKKWSIEKGRVRDKGGMWPLSLSKLCSMSCRIGQISSCDWKIFRAEVLCPPFAENSLRL